MGFNPSSELCTVGQTYPYFVNTRKQIKPKDFVVLADEALNEDRKAVSTVRVMGVHDYNEDKEQGDKLIADCTKSPRLKLFIGKAELGDYFAELDKKRKREELTAKLEARFKEAEKMSLYQKLAETDPEMKSLLTELEALK